MELCNKTNVILLKYQFTFTTKPRVRIYDDIVCELSSTTPLSMYNLEIR